MRWKGVAIVCIVLLFCGCSKSNDSIADVITLRNKILNGNGCSFSATVNADYGEDLYTFSMDCIADKEGNVSFSVTKPYAIAGITGKVSTDSGIITFDNKILAFQKFPDDNVSPVSSPWIFMKTLRSGYIRGCTGNNGNYQIEIDDSYEEDALRLNIIIEKNLPVYSEIFWNGRRVISITVDNFTYL